MWEQRNVIWNLKRNKEKSCILVRQQHQSSRVDFVLLSTTRVYRVEAQIIIRWNLCQHLRLCPKASQELSVYPGYPPAARPNMRLLLSMSSAHCDCPSLTNPQTPPASQLMNNASFCVGVETQDHDFKQSPFRQCCVCGRAWAPSACGHQGPTVSGQVISNLATSDHSPSLMSLWPEFHFRANSCRDEQTQRGNDCIQPHQVWKQPHIDNVGGFF